ncbi:GMC family oxidoreductase N-terminal domain-containing protein [Leifsonia poae]|uniref:GMC family oxidoreductase N-terminal domain-containing protein n=1 Tax=Leifsonia poae TaxID=110933 RepID=UPI003D695CB4
MSASTVRDRNASAWLLTPDGSRTRPDLLDGMRRYADTDEVDIAIIGCGAGGSVLLQRLARAGWSAVAFDAGPFWDPERDWVSDEAGSHHLYWTEPRQIGGGDPVPLGSNNSGRGVGGSMIHYAGYTPRFHPSDFRTLTTDGVGADWPIAYGDLARYYADIENELPVAGEDWPWGDPHSYPHHAHPVSGNGETFLRGAEAAGVTAKVGPVAIANGRFGHRPHCIYRGFCLQGCKVNAKASPLITHLPDALEHGAEVRADSMVASIGFDERTGRATGVHYFRDGVPRFQRARMVAVAGYSIETPGCCSTRHRRASRTGCATTSTRPGATSWCRARRRRPAASRTRSGCGRRPRPRSAPSSSTRPTRRNPTSAGTPSRRCRRCRSRGRST